MKIDLLVTTYKRLKDLNLLIRNLENQTYDNFQLQIFDGTPDDSIKKSVENYLLSERNKKYPVFYHYTGCGMTKQRNIAVDKTVGDISIFLDDDVLLEPDYLYEVARVFDEDVEKNIAGLNGFNTKTNGTIGKRQRFFRMIGLLPRIGNAMYLQWGHSTPHWEGEQFDGIRDCDVLIGFNMAFRTSVLKKFRFDIFYEQYPTYVLYDDQDICLRMKKAGFRIVQAGNAKLVHNISPSGRPPGDHYGFQTTFNAYRNWKTHIKNPNLIVKIKFWAFEVLNIIFLSISNVINWRKFDQVKGRIEGIVAIAYGYQDYLGWEKTKTLKKND